MPKEAEISCKNVFKCEDKSALKKEFNQKWIELINQLEKSKGQVLPVKMIDKHFSTRHNKCRWNVCFIFSLREIKYDEHKVKSCYLLPLIRRR